MKKATIDGILQPVDELTQHSRSEKVKLHFWSVLKKAASHIPFIEDVVAAYYCAFDPATPQRVRAVLIAALAYFVMPLDVIPDIFPVFGFTDDVTVLTIAITTMRTYIKESHHEAARKILGKVIKNKIKPL